MANWNYYLVNYKGREIVLGTKTRAKDKSRPIKNHMKVWGYTDKELTIIKEVDSEYAKEHNIMQMKLKNE